MPPKKQSRLPLNCAEDVTLLAQFTAAPSCPRANQPTHSHSRDNPGRALPFGCEVSLASTLGFLCGISDHSAHVVALCVEELVVRTGVRIVVAINKEGTNSASDIVADKILMDIKDGLKRIFGHLARVHAAQQLENLKDLVLAAIVDLCRNRIFSRIGSQRYKKEYKRDKKFFGSPIQRIIDAFNSLHPPQTRRPEIDVFIDNAAGFVKLLNKLESCNPNEAAKSLQNIVQAASQLMESTNFNRVFSNLVLDPAIKTGFVSRLSKLARYYESSYFLIQLARRSGLFKTPVDVTVVSLEPKYLLRAQFSPTEYGMETCISRHPSGGLQIFSIQNIGRLLGQGFNQVQTSFKRALQKNLAESKIHAEVQIIAYYELHPVIRKPRVICSSKDACFLCNEFVRHHGGFHIPRTHGNLYTAWRVPPVQTLNDVHNRLDQFLQNCAKSLVQQFEENPERRVSLIRNENESTIFPYPQLMAGLEGIVPLVEEPSERPAVSKQNNKKKKGQQPPVQEHTFSTQERTALVEEPPERPVASKRKEQKGQQPPVKQDTDAPSPSRQIRADVLPKNMHPHECPTSTGSTYADSNGSKVTQIYNHEVPAQPNQRIFTSENESDRLVENHGRRSTPSEPDTSEEVEISNLRGESPEFQSRVSELVFEILRSHSPEPKLFFGAPRPPSPILETSNHDKHMPINEHRPLITSTAGSLGTDYDIINGDQDGDTLQALDRSRHSPQVSSRSSRQSARKPSKENLERPESGNHDLDSEPAGISTSDPEPAPESWPDPEPTLKIKTNSHSNLKSLPHRSIPEFPKVDENLTISAPSSLVPSIGSTKSSIKNNRSIPPKVLRRGQPTYVRLDLSEIIPCYTTGKIHIYPELLMTKTSRPVEARIEWLDRNHAKAVRAEKPKGYHDLQEKTRGVDFDGGNADCIYVANGRDVVIIESNRM